MNTRRLISFAAAFALVAAGAWALRGKATGEPCRLRHELREVRGSSLEPILRPGSVVRLAMDPEGCLEIGRGDLVALRHSGRGGAPLLKLVRALPGDSFGLRALTDGQREIRVNGQALENSEGKPFLLSAANSRMLALYERQYGGLVPEGAYLLLGNDPSGSLDSTRFGLAGRGDILGKALR